MEICPQIKENGGSGIKWHKKWRDIPWDFFSVFCTPFNNTKSRENCDQKFISRVLLTPSEIEWSKLTTKFELNLEIK